MLDYRAWRAGLCEECQTHEGWWDPAKGGSRFAMTADQRRCPGCELVEQAQDQTPKDAKGIKTFLIPQTDPDTYADGQRVREGRRGD